MAEPVEVEAYRLPDIARAKGVEPGQVSRYAKKRFPAFKEGSVWHVRADKIHMLRLSDEVLAELGAPLSVFTSNPDAFPSQGAHSPQAVPGEADPSAGVELGDDELRRQLEAAEQRNELLRERNRAAAAERDAALGRVAELERKLAVERAETKRLAQMVALSVQRHTAPEPD